MADTATLEATVDALRDEVAELRRDMRELRRLLGAAPGHLKPRTTEERMAGLERIRAIRERILQSRGGELLPPMAEEIAAMREERAAEG